MNLNSSRYSVCRLYGKSRIGNNRKVMATFMDKVALVVGSTHKIHRVRSAPCQEVAVIIEFSGRLGRSIVPSNGDRNNCGVRIIVYPSGIQHAKAEREDALKRKTPKAEANVETICPLCTQQTKYLPWMRGRVGAQLLARKTLRPPWSLAFCRKLKLGAGF